MMFLLGINSSEVKCHLELGDIALYICNANWTNMSPHCRGIITFQSFISQSRVSLSQTHLRRPARQNTGSSSPKAQKSGGIQETPRHMILLSSPVEL